ncbi:MAG: hypothetical protein CMJ34_09555 [Phycisphaerae bacterium]|nr:hypothetical protein [Phycisphaerae bacterium]
MIHAAITAVALSCCTTFTIVDDTDWSEEGTMIEFKGGSVADYIDEVTDGFKAVNHDPNIILLPGTEGVILPAMSLRVMHPGDAFAAISDHVYTTESGIDVMVDFETVGSGSSIFRISGNEWRPPRARTAPRAASPAVHDEVSVSIIRVPEARMASAVTLAGRVLDLAGLSETTSLVPLPQDDLLLVSSTDTGHSLVGEIVFEVVRPKKKSEEQSRGRRGSPIDPESRRALRAELSELAKRKVDDSTDPEARKVVDEGFRRTLDRLRNTN